VIESILATRGYVAVARGPLAYAIEQPDAVLEDLRLDPTTEVTSEHHPELLGGVTLLHAGGAVVAEPTRPYRTYDAATPSAHSTELTLIPYYAWSNRGLHPMRVWIPALT
jgi:uncharacterized protein